MWENLRIDDLILGKLLGSGSYGLVYEARIKGHDGIYSVKKIDKSKYKRIKKGEMYLKNEILILKSLAHENIVKLYSSNLETSLYKYLITEFCNGGDLQENLDHYKKEYDRPFSEEEVQHIMRQIVSAMKYLHVEKEIIHRDLKMENILLHYDNENDREQKNVLKAKVKIIDFGFARYMHGIIKSVVGTPLYMDPRILFKHNNIGDSKDFKYDEKADIYSLGNICYTLLTGNQLFNVENMEQLLLSVNKGEYKLPANLSKETISFLNSMLRFDPKKRLDIAKLSEHKFITKDVKDFASIDTEKVRDNLNGSLLVFNLNKSSMPYLNESVFDKKEEIKKLNENEEIDEIKQKIIDDINKAEEKSKEINKSSNEDKNRNKEEQKRNEDIEKLIWDSFDVINNNEICYEPKMAPFIPGTEPNLFLIYE